MEAPAGHCRALLWGASPSLIFSFGLPSPALRGRQGNVLPTCAPPLSFMPRKLRRR